MTPLRRTKVALILTEDERVRPTRWAYRLRTALSAAHADRDADETAEQVDVVPPDGKGSEEIVGEKGYHSNQSLLDLLSSCSSLLIS